MTPIDAVSRLAEIVSSRAEFTEDDIYTAMAEAGLAADVADRAFKFTQTAWARTVLTGVGVRFAPDYLCFNAAGEVIDSGRLDQEVYYLAAMELVPQYAKSAGFLRLVRMSADMNAVNQALHKGSKPENLSMGPAAFFMEAPTQAGLVRARQILAERVGKS
jgi:hypothetical protein